jgi:hypothetical protein
MPHLRLASEIDIPHELLDTQMRDEWESLKALGDSVRQNLKLRPIAAPDDDADLERPSFLSPTAAFPHTFSSSLATTGLSVAPSAVPRLSPPPQFGLLAARAAEVGALTRIESAYYIVCRLLEPPTLCHSSSHST